MLPPWCPLEWVALGFLALAIAERVGPGLGAGGPHAGWVTPPAEPLSGPILVRAAGHKASLCWAAQCRLPSPARSRPAAVPLHGGSSPRPLGPPLLRAAQASLDSGEGDGTLAGDGARDPQTGMECGTPSQRWGRRPPDRDGAGDPQPLMGHRTPSQGHCPPSMILTGLSAGKAQPLSSPPSPPNHPSRGHGTGQLVL